MALLSDSWKLDMFAFLVGALTLAYFYVKYAYSYWERKGFKTLPSYSYLLGHFKSLFSMEVSFGDWCKNIYNSTKEPFIGIYGILRPMLLVRDPELVRSILVKDFANFADRGVHSNEDYDPLSGNLFSITGQKWKNMRSKLTPTFTSGKLKGMISTLNECGFKLQKHLDKLAAKREMLDVREVSACHSTNVIASVAFGIEINCLENPNNEFRVNGRKALDQSFMNVIRGLISFVQPKLMSILRLKSVNSDVERFIMSVVKDNMEYREKNNVSRKDFFQLLLQLRNNGTVQLDDKWETVIKADEKQKSLSVNEMAAQAFIFFVAGFETSSTTLSFCLYEIVKNPEIQNRVIEEIDRVLEAHNGQFTYESISDMKYLESCIDETLRKYPPLTILNRACLSDYKIPNTNKIIEKGTEMFIPIFGLQRDEKYYEEPNKFDPDRFNEENSVGKNQSNRPYYPFGDGPRNCIGMRLGKMQTKVGLVM
ncbi:probable cytochrome P450 6d5, partial [Contarinia nasturtii]|uniref:probable cytochrome P450 6d5 n=1 Tax=Contarinia nasturtii TaxID=265458 RepID=UPI0012D3E6C4